MRFTMEDFVMFVPAAGLGERVKARGVKPFIHVEEKDRNWLAINEVINMVPDEMDVEIAVRREMGCPPLGRETVVHFIEPTSGQAQTVYRWLRTTRLRNFVLISNCDNVIDRKSIIEGIQSLDYDKCPGVVFTFRPKQKNDERWSYVRKDGVGRILEIAEKRPISEDAVAGVYLLNMFNLCQSIHAEDVYLSEALARMPKLQARRAIEYKGWNDLNQLAELEDGVRQYI